MTRKAAPQLLPEQVAALDALDAGKTDFEAGIDPAWLRDADFIAARNARRRQGREEVQRRLDALAVKAVDALEAALEDPATRLRAAQVVLRAVRLEKPEGWSSGPTTPAQVRKDWECQLFIDSL
jgi:hypothetical protein